MKSNTTYFVLLLALGFLVHGISLQNPYYYDDIAFIQSNAWIGSGLGLDWYRQIFYDGEMLHIGYRPTLMLSYDLNAQILGKTPASFRFFTILLHSLNAFLVFLLILLFTKRSKYHSKLLSFFISALFLIHPIQTLAINFIWKRSTVLCVFFMLCGLLLHILARQKRGKEKWFFHVGELFAVALAVTSKELGVIYLLFVVLYDLLTTKLKEFRIQDGVFSGLLGTLVFGFTYFRLHVIENFARTARFGIGSGTGTISWIEGQIQTWKTNFTTIGDYAWQLLVPTPLLMDDMKHVVDFEWLYIVVFAFLFFFPLVYFFKKREHRVLTAFIFGLFWFPLLPTTSFWPTFFLKDQIRLYIPVLAYSILLVFVVFYIFEKTHNKKLRNFVLGIILVVFGATSIIQNLKYSKPLLIWSDVLSQYPKSKIAFENVGYILSKQGRFKEVATLYEQASELYPENHGYKIQVYTNRALANMNTGGFNEKLDHIAQKDLQFSDRQALAYAYFTIGEYDKAETLLLDLLQYQPRSIYLHMSLAKIWQNKGDFINAKKAALNILEIDPNDIDAKRMLTQLKDVDIYN